MSPLSPDPFVAIQSQPAVTDVCVRQVGGGRYFTLALVVSVRQRPFHGRSMQRARGPVAAAAATGVALGQFDRRRIRLNVTYVAWTTRLLAESIAVRNVRLDVRHTCGDVLQLQCQAVYSIQQKCSRSLYGTVNPSSAIFLQVFWLIGILVSINIVAVRRARLRSTGMSDRSRVYHLCVYLAPSDFCS